MPTFPRSPDVAPRLESGGRLGPVGQWWRRTIAQTIGCLLSSIATLAQRLSHMRRINIAGCARRPRARLPRGLLSNLRSSRWRSRSPPRWPPPAAKEAQGSVRRDRGLGGEDAPPAFPRGLTAGGAHPGRETLRLGPSGFPPRSAQADHGRPDMRSQARDGGDGPPSYSGCAEQRGEWPALRLKSLKRSGVSFRRLPTSLPYGESHIGHPSRRRRSIWRSFAARASAASRSSRSASWRA
jgi:hypothetical protein